MKTGIGGFVVGVVVGLVGLYVAAFVVGAGLSDGSRFAAPSLGGWL